MTNPSSLRRKAQSREKWNYKFFESKWLPEDDIISFITRISKSWNQLRGEIKKPTGNKKDISLICKIVKLFQINSLQFWMVARRNQAHEENRSLDKLSQKLCTFESNLSEIIVEECFKVVNYIFNY